MSLSVHRSHNVTVLLYDLVFPAKYRLRLLLGFGVVGLGGAFGGHLV